MRPSNVALQVLFGRSRDNCKSGRVSESESYGGSHMAAVLHIACLSKSESGERECETTAHMFVHRCCCLSVVERFAGGCVGSALGLHPPAMSSCTEKFDGFFLLLLAWKRHVGIDTWWPALFLRFVAVASTCGLP